MKRAGRLLLGAILLGGLWLLLCGCALADGNVWPQEGQTVKKNGKLMLDVSYTENGYFLAAV